MSETKSLVLKAKQKSSRNAAILVTGLSSAFASVQAFALDQDANDQITVALTGAQTSTNLVVVGLIGLAAVVCGLGLAYKLMGK